MKTPPEAHKALNRLVANPDFVVFTNWLRAEHEQNYKALVTSTSTVLVHQLQGSTLCLTDILQAISSAQPALA